MAIPLLIAGGVAAAGAIGGGIAAAAKAGQNRRAAQPFYDPSGKTGYNPNASNWGGKAGGLEEYQRNLHNSQMGVEGREAFQANYGRANEWENQNIQARAAQGQAANLMMNRATGATPSIASQQGAIDMQRAQAAQASQAASARGAAGIALAQQNAANNTANAQAQISGQTQINAANERLAAEQAAFGAYSNMRGGDLATQGQVAGQEQFQAQMQQANRQANDQRAMGYEQLKFGSSQAQMGAKMQEQGILAQSHNAKEGLQQQTAQANANREAAWVEKIIPSDEQMKMGMDMAGLMNGGKKKDESSDLGGAFGAAGKSGGGNDMGQYMQLASMAMKSDERSKVEYRANGGPVTAGRPYVVGERGPELIVPRRSGTVIPNRRAMTTKEMLDDRYRQNQPVDQGGPSVDDMLDDRARQTAPAAEDRMARDELNAAIEQSIAANERQTNTQASRDAALTQQPSAEQTLQDEAARQQWERINGPIAKAEDEARTSDNLKEMQRTNARLGTGGGGKEKPWYMQDVDSSGLSLFGGGRRPAGGSVWSGGNTFESDDRAKLAAAWDAGRRSAGDDLQRYQGMTPEELQEAAKKDRLADSLRAARRDTWDAALMSAQDKLDAEDTSEPPAEPQFVAPPISTTLPPKLERGARPATMGRNMPLPSRMRSDERTKVPIDKGPLADANRKMGGQPYTYRPEHTPEHERVGQPHFGFMAQNLERNPITGTAVEERPDGYKGVDRDRMLQVVASGLSDLQRQQDELRMGLSKGGRRRVA